MKPLPEGIREKSGRLYIEFQYAKKRYYESTGLIARNAEGKLHRSNIVEAAKQRNRRLEGFKYGIETDDDSGDDLKTGTFAEVAQAYLDALEVKTSTRTSYKQLLQIYWMSSLQHRQVSAIKRPKLRKIVRETKWSSNKVKRNAVSVLHQIFEFAREDGYRDDNPAQKLATKSNRLQSTAEIDREHPYKPSERDTLLNWLQSNARVETYAYFLTAFFTGMRTGELLALTWEDFDGKSLLVNKARVRGEITTTKTHKARTVAIPDRVIKAINTLPSRFKQGSIFTNQYGREYHSGYHLNKKFREAHEKTRIRHREGPYPWRHTYASIGLTGGADPGWMAKQLGHSQQMFYTVYAYWINSDERDRYELAKIQ